MLYRLPQLSWSARMHKQESMDSEGFKNEAVGASGAEGQNRSLAIEQLEAQIEAQERAEMICKEWIC